MATPGHRSAYRGGPGRAGPGRRVHAGDQRHDGQDPALPELAAFAAPGRADRGGAEHEADDPCRRPGGPGKAAGLGAGLAARRSGWPPLARPAGAALAASYAWLGWNLLSAARGYVGQRKRLLEVKPLV
ncbi:hypothetical protein RA210_U50254 [Rubrivivax sp. A210]|nr:hypothetical protein RA210_U50254 [Rubrivivax sp. A210]